MSRDFTKRILSSVGAIMLALAFVYMLAFFLVFGCLADQSRAVADCRGNMAGELVYWSLSKVLK